MPAMKPIRYTPVSVPHPNQSVYQCSECGALILGGKNRTTHTQFHKSLGK